MIGITLGDAGGIGPEVILKALRRRRWGRELRFVLIGDAGVLQATAAELGMRVPPSWPVVSALEAAGAGDRARSRAGPVTIWAPGAVPRVTRTPGRISVPAARAAGQWVNLAVEACLDGRLDAMVTGPICKESFVRAGLNVPGHTELIADLTGAKDFAMMLVGGALRVVLVTRHLPLGHVPRALTRRSIVDTVRLAAEACPWLGLAKAKIGVCALNPHAGDGGVLGRAEIETIAPAVQAARRNGIRAEGPVPADVIFHKAVHGEYGIVVAMYHDQGLAPLKMLAFDTGVNITLGLPITRTSPDHGTAFDIAGKGVAKPDSMIAAVRTASELARRPNPWRNRNPDADR
ncbi:MAG: 4-hydroxythreonine-4-phosphate dehydrogenase PdxA [Kiritimatiellae bacterium]|nr:4-hydroxythreonine-4-phosphate dehydrogenase PdxA [Kiritimatiellia bacterium]